MRGAPLSWRNPHEAPPNLCECECGQAVSPGFRFATQRCSNKHRRKIWDQYHPRLDLSGLPLDVAQRCLRMAEEAVKAAREGLERATIDATRPVTHGRDARPSCRLRLDLETWQELDKLCCQGQIAKSHFVKGLIWSKAQEAQ